MSFSTKERGLLRDLARKVAEVAGLPIMAERRAMWKRHNALRRVRPMILVFPEGSWGELLAQSALKCSDEKARRVEWQLRSRLYYHERLRDDMVIEREWVVGKAIKHTGWGLEPKNIPSTEARGAWKFDPVLNSPEDLKKLRFPEVSHDEKATSPRPRSCSATSWT